MLAVGLRVVTEWGPGVVEESSPRRVFVRLGTYGYERIVPERAPMGAGAL